MDKINEKILKLLQEDGRMKIQDMAKKLDLSHTAVHVRLIKLQKENIVEGFNVKINPKKFDKTSLFIVYATVDHNNPDTKTIHKNLMEMKEIEEVLTLTGDWDIMMKVRTTDVDQLVNFLMKDIQKRIPGFIRNNTVTVIEESSKDFEI